MPGSYSFPKSVRLNSAESFSAVFHQATKLTYREFSVYVASNKTNTPRLGLAVSKKNAKKAVTRNLIKRIVRESFRINQNKLASLDIIFVARYAAGQSSRQQLHAALQAVWNRLEK